MLERLNDYLRIKVRAFAEYHFIFKSCLWNCLQISRFIFLFTPKLLRACRTYGISMVSNSEPRINAENNHVVKSRLSRHNSWSLCADHCRCVQNLSRAASNHFLVPTMLPPGSAHVLVRFALESFPSSLSYSALHQHHYLSSNNKIVNDLQQSPVHFCKLLIQVACLSSN